MKRAIPFLVVLCLLGSIVVPISADDGTGEMPPRENKEYEEYENLVHPDEDGEVVILSNPDEPIYPEDDQKNFEGEPLIAPNPESGNSGDEPLIAPNPESNQDLGQDDDGRGFPMTAASILAGILLAVIVMVGIAVKRKR